MKYWGAVWCYDYRLISILTLILIFYFADFSAMRQAVMIFQNFSGKVLQDLLKFYIIVPCTLKAEGVILK